MVENIVFEIGEGEKISISARDLARALHKMNYGEEFKKGSGNKALAEVLDQYLNSMSASPFSQGQKMVEEVFARTHPTLQGCLVNFVFGILSGLAEIRYTDARNEKAVELARLAKEIADKHGLQPFI